MRVAALYDIYGNHPTLEAVLHEIDLSDVDQIVVGGYIVPGPMFLLPYLPYTKRYAYSNIKKPNV